jgi:hypothetical protein
MQSHALGAFVKFLLFTLLLCSFLSAQDQTFAVVIRTEKIGTPKHSCMSYEWLPNVFSFESTSRATKVLCKP